MTAWPPVTFAWVDSSETTFGTQHIRFDEDVLAINMTHSEGNFATCDVTIKNPYSGLSAPGRSTWVWLSKLRDDGTGFQPFFFGRQISTPDDIQAEAITIKFVARSIHWLKLKQHQADLLRANGAPYDPVFVNVNQRSTPDSVLEFFSAVWHFDRVTSEALSGGEVDLQVSYSDILIPEDGFIVFEETDHFYDSFNFTIGQEPLKTVLVKADVHWTQYGSGVLDMRPGNIECWTGGSIISGWPKPGASLSGGYTVWGGFAFGNAEYGTAQPHHITWENQQKTHQEGDSMTLDESWTTYPVGGDLIIYNKAVQAGLVIPPPIWTIPGLPDSFDGVNIPLHVQWSELLVAYWSVNTSLSLEYNAARPRHEKLNFSLTADLQPVFDDIHEPASVDTEVLPISGADCGLPIINTASWYTLSISGQHVEAGTVVVSTPEFIGGPLFAVALNSGESVGSFEPDWSDVIGDVIVDGGVHWAMIGGDVPIDFPTWRDVADSVVVPGLIIRSQYYLPPPTDIFGHPLPAPPSGTNAFQLCIVGGTTEVYSNGLNGIADTSPSWPEPRFSVTPGGTTTDGSAVWLSLGSGNSSNAGTNAVIDIPLGINTSARSYFPTDRGQQSIAALINMASNHLRMRSRVVKISFETKFDNGLDMSCRSGVIIYDHRLPGGVAQGKVTSYSLEANGDTGEFICKVTAECAPGLVPIGHESVVAVDGEGTYAQSGYMQSGYQQMTGQTVVVENGLTGAKVGYTPPIDEPDDDGLVFPLTSASQVIVDKRWITGLPPNAPAYVPNAILPITVKSTNPFTGVVTQTTFIEPVPNGFTPVVFTQQVQTPYLGPQDETIIIYYPVTQFWLELLPLNRPFSNQYTLTTTDLGIEDMINLQAPASQ